MNVTVRIIRFICFCVIVAAEHTLRMALEIVLHAKKPLQ